MKSTWRGAGSRTVQSLSPLSRRQALHVMARVHHVWEPLPEPSSPGGGGTAETPPNPRHAHVTHTNLCERQHQRPDQTRSREPAASPGRKGQGPLGNSLPRPRSLRAHGSGRSCRRPHRGAGHLLGTHGGHARRLPPAPPHRCSRDSATHPGLACQESPAGRPGVSRWPAAPSPSPQVCKRCICIFPRPPDT